MTSPQANTSVQNNSQVSTTEKLQTPVEVVGIVTLENVIERILLTDIHDEKDNLLKLGDTSLVYQKNATCDSSTDDNFLR